MIEDPRRQFSRDLFNQLNLSIKRYAPGMVPVRDQIQGTSFFPGGTGLWCERASVPNQTSMQPRVMVLGQDFDTDEGYQRSLVQGCENLRSPTWRNLSDVMQRASIPMTDCFFTNVFMGLRRDGRNTGPSPAWVDEQFVAACRHFLEVQLNAMKPSLILVLGLQAARFLGSIAGWPETWQGRRSFAQFDADGVALIPEIEFGGRGWKSTVALLVHPSFRTQNVGRRRWEGHQGDLAEVMLLRRAWELSRKLLL